MKKKKDLKKYIFFNLKDILKKINELETLL